MYAIVHDGGHQLRVEPGQIYRIQRKAADVGETLTFDNVAMVGGDEPRFGAPYVDGAKVEATVVRQLRGKKLVIRHFRRRKNSRRKNGHRQDYTEIRVDSINA